MTVWVVNYGSVDGGHTLAICATEARAERAIREYVEHENTREIEADARRKAEGEWDEEIDREHRWHIRQDVPLRAYRPWCGDPDEIEYADHVYGYEVEVLT